MTNLIAKTMCRNLVHFFKNSSVAYVSFALPFLEKKHFLFITWHNVSVKHSSGYPAKFDPKVVSSKDIESTTEFSDPIYYPFARQSGRQALIASPERLSKLCRLLQCETDEAKDLTEKHQFLVYMNFELLEEKVDLLLSYGLNHGHVRYTPRMLYNLSIKSLKERLELLKKKDLLTWKSVTYHLACEHKDFVKGFRYLCQEIDSLEGFPNRREYVKHRLSCSDSELDNLLSTYPMKNMSNFKTKNMLDFFLIEMEQSADFIFRNRRLTMFSVKRLQTRWKVMKLLEVKKEKEMLRIWELTHSDFNLQFQEFLEIDDVS